MNRSQAFGSPGRVFGSALQFLSNVGTPNSRERSASRSRHHHRDPSIDDDERTCVNIEGGSSAFEVPDEGGSLTAVSARPHQRRSSGDVDFTPARSIPLSELSPSPSPYPGSKSAVPSEDEEDGDDVRLSLRPLIGEDGGRPAACREGRVRGWRSVFREGGLGRFLFGTWTGYQVYVALLVIWVGGFGFGNLLMNRFILWTGTYKFPYPLTTTWIQLFITHILLLGWSALTRACARTFQRMGFKDVVAPSPGSTSDGGFRTFRSGPSNALASICRPGTGGIAGGGWFEFDRKTALQVLPVALIYTGSVTLSNVSFAYVPIPVYTVSRIATVPLALLLTAFITRTTHSVAALSSALSATLNLLMASIRTGVRAPWEGVASGVVSALLTALYPVILLQTHRTLASSMVPQGASLLPAFIDATPIPPSQSDHHHHQQGPASADDADSEQASSSGPTGTRSSETRSYYQILHYTSLLSVLLLAPAVLVSREAANIAHNCYFLDVPWFWFLVAAASACAFLAFLPFLLLVAAVGPLTAAFVAVPREALQVAVLGGRMPVRAWVGAALCWASSAWFAGARRAEGRRWVVGVGAGLEVVGGR